MMNKHPIIRLDVSVRIIEATTRNPKKKIAVRIPPIIDTTSIVRLGCGARPGPVEGEKKIYNQGRSCDNDNSCKEKQIDIFEITV